MAKELWEQVQSLALTHASPYPSQGGYLQRVYRCGLPMLGGKNWARYGWKEVTCEACLREGLTFSASRIGVFCSAYLDIVARLKELGYEQP